MNATETPRQGFVSVRVLPGDLPAWGVHKAGEETQEDTRPYQAPSVEGSGNHFVAWTEKIALALSSPERTVTSAFTGSVVFRFWAAE